MGNNTTSTPSIYKPKAFSKEHQLYAKYGSTPSRRQLRQFNKYWKSDQRQFDEILHDRREFDRMFESGYRNLEYLRNKYKAKPITTAPSTPVTSLESKYKGKITINDYWTKVAKDNGFNSMYDVAEWQSKNGLYVDGKFGNKSKLKMQTLNAKPATTPTLKSTKQPIITPQLESTKQPETTPTFAHRQVTSAFNDVPVDIVKRSNGVPDSSDLVVLQPNESKSRETIKFNLNNFARANGLEVTRQLDQDLVRWDPDGFGDFWIDSSGNIYEGGTLFDNTKKVNINSGLGYGERKARYEALQKAVQGFDGATNTYGIKIVEPEKTKSAYYTPTMATYRNFYKQGGTMNRINYFQQGGQTRPKPSGYRFTSRTHNFTPGYNIVTQYMYPTYTRTAKDGTTYEGWNDFDITSGRVIYNTPTQSDTVYYNTPDSYMHGEHSIDPIGTTKDQNSAKNRFYKYTKWSKPEDDDQSKSAHKRAVSGKKNGGTMNRINYFQQGGAAPQQNIQQQVEALVQAAAQGDEQATKQITQIMEAAKSGNKQAIQLAQMIQQTIEKMKSQATAAKWGAKLGYIKSLKYAKGGKTCPDCEKKVEMKACGGKKAKKRYFGGLI